MAGIGTGLAGAIGGAGNASQQQQQFQAGIDERQRDRESRLFETMLSSKYPDIAAAAVQGLMNPSKRQGKSVFTNTPLHNPWVDKITELMNRPDHQGVSQTPSGSPAGGTGMPATGIGGEVKALPPAPGAAPVQQTVKPAGGAPLSAAMPSSAVDSPQGVAAGGPPPLTWQGPVGGPPRGAGLMNPWEKAQLEVRGHAYGSAAEMMGRMEAAGLAAPGSMDAMIARFGANGERTPATQGTPPPPAPIDYTDPQTRIRASAAGINIPKPEFQNVTGGAGVPFEKLNPSQQAAIQKNYPNAGAGDVFEMRHDAMGMVPDQWYPIARPGMAQNQDFESAISTAVAPIGRKDIDAELTRRGTAARSQVQAAVQRGDFTEANRIVNQLQSSADSLRAGMISGATRLQVNVGTEAAKENIAPGEPEYWADQTIKDTQNLRSLNNQPMLKAAVMKELASRGVDLNNLDQASRTMAITSKDIQRILPSIESQAKDLDKMGLMGPMGGRWRELVAGKVGAGELAGGNAQNAKKIGRFMADTELLKTALMKAHTGARGSAALLDEFNNVLGAGWRDTPTFMGSLQGVKDWIDTYAQRLPTNTGGGPPSPGGSSSVIDYVRDANGKLVPKP